jgi:diguanylate cyclase (GGDEF)-like protein/PAS domain S-box-containing protein
MSYKTVSKKMIIIVPILFLLLATVRICINYNGNKDSVEHFIEEQSKLVDSLYMTHRAYYQNLYLNKIIELDEKTLAGLPSYSSEQISKTFSDKNALHVNISTVSDRARNPLNQADEFELKAINYFKKNQKSQKYFKEEDKFYQYASPMRINHKCLKCHGKREDAPEFIAKKYDKAYDYKLGELRGILSIKIPMENVNTIFDKQFYASLVYDFIMISIVSMLALFLIRFFSRLNVELEKDLDERTNELRHSLSNLESYKDAIDDNLIVTKTDLDGKIIYANDNFCKTTGYSRDEIIGNTHNIVKDKAYPNSFYKKMWDTITAKKTWHGRIKNRKKDGTPYWINASISPIFDGDGNTKEYISIRHNITELIEQKNEIKHITTTDALTKLKNRDALLESIESMDNISLVLINIDTFSQINDFYGHDNGDIVLVKFANRLKEICDKDSNMHLFRVSGDEFVILMHNIETHNVVLKVQDISKNINSYKYNVHGELIEVSTTISISFEDKDKLLMTADMALKIARRESRNITVYDKEMSLNKEYKNNMLWTKKIKNAIKNDKIILYFQGIVDNETREVNKYESLIRLVDEDGSIISPYFFLDIAKKAKLYKQLTKIVIQKSFEIFRENKSEFSINLSIDDIVDEDIYHYILEMLEIYNVSNRVIFEIVESESIENFQEIQKFITSVKELGCRIAIDDFGTGYSNFEYLMRLEPDFIKIDGSIIKNILTDSKSEIITSTIVDFAKRVNIKVIAEFVEDEEVFNKVKELGIEYTQGYYFSKPQASLM